MARFHDIIKIHNNETDSIPWNILKYSHIQTE
jgi:hypothetical protein